MGKWRKWPLRFAYAIYVKNEIKKGLSCNFCNERIKEEEEAAENSGFDKVRILQVPLLFGCQELKFSTHRQSFVFLIIQSFLFSLQDSQPALSQCQELVLACVHGDAADMADPLADLIHNSVAVGDATGENDLVNLSAEYRRHSADILGYLIGEGMKYVFRFLIALFKGHPGYIAHIVGSQIGVEAALAVDLFCDLRLGVFAGKAHFHQGAYRERAGALGREGAVAVQGVVYIHHPAALMGAYGYAAAHVGHDQIQSVIGNSLFLGVALGHGLLIQRVENADAGQFRQTGVAGHRSELVHHHRVYYVGGNAQRSGDLIGQKSSQVGSVL